ncbi:hypothetical protein [Xanthocytophaga agilis]|uniref:Secreted protein n=1 Tax=Xanthocytophaga agilis TaxID=3048010 RepID=A0AAE3R395_9BACT|nr:hypothetical protein [Xanthocytophaga agilis]MDJ1502934.1 hypothetical protein [Xanthocytophaga agilis]
MEIKKYTRIVLLGLVLLAIPFSAHSQRKKKSKDNAAYMEADARAAATASRKPPDPFGFLKSNDQHKKNKDCGCPGTKKGERQRRKEFKAHRKRK